MSRENYGMMNQEIQDDEVTIDLMELFSALWAKKTIIILSAVFMALVAFVGTKMFVTPKYTSVTKLFVMTKNDDTSASATYTDLQTGSMLTKDYMELVKSRPVLEKTISKLKLDVTPEELAEMITTETPTDTRIMSISVTDDDPKEAKAFCKEEAGVLKFDHVSFRYPGADEDVLHDIHFTARPGETTAIIGSTGSGKSTLVNLIPRFYDVTDGSIRLDGTDIREVTQHDLRDKLGYVPQKGLLFSGDIASNIMFGNPEGGGQEMKEAAQIAQATEFIEAKPNKYESPISQGGSNVSGGQKQRLSIARAIAKRPEVFIFDDSFSALDFKTDVALRKALKKRTKESTVLIVAQRISTILNAEQIIVLDDGKIAGIGTHKELLRNCEVYKQIAASQLSEKELQDGMQSEDRKTEDIKSETIKTEERKEAISAKTAEQEVRSDV